MYLAGTNTYINLRDIKNILISADDQTQVVIYYLQGGSLTINNPNKTSAQDLLKMLSEETAKIQNYSRG
jgi:hypothetical protein